MAASALASPDRERALIELLQEEHQAYGECGSGEIVRRRGWVLLALARAPLTDEAIPLVLEELETGYHPYLLAAAATALRAAVAPSAAFAPSLLRAMETLARRDDYVNLAAWGGSPASIERSAFGELLGALRWLGDQAQGISTRLLPLTSKRGPLEDGNRLALVEILATLPQPDFNGASDCCSLTLPWRRQPARGDGTALVASVSFEDQDGLAYAWGDLLVGKPSVVVFFYTRCENEQKCSLTVAKLAQLQRLLSEAGGADGVNLVAITYDPDFDLPVRLREYARNRTLVPGSRCKVLRAKAGMEALQQYFALGVNFTGSQVNRHRIEVFILDATGAISATHQRLGWRPAEVMAEAQRLTTAQTPCRMEGATPAAAVASATPGVWAVLLALLPKCPICGATYLSSTGLVALPYLQGWERLWPAVLLALLVNLLAIASMASARRHWAPLIWACAGAVMLVGPGLAMGRPEGLLVGAALTAIGSGLAVAAATQRLIGRPSRSLFRLGIRR